MGRNDGSDEAMEPEDQLTAKTREQLRSSRQALLRLHKTLLEFERKAYEKANGRIANSYEFLGLVMHNAWFAWLHHLSELIVQMDELIDAGESSSETTGSALIEQARLLLVPRESGGEFQSKYFQSLQESPEVVLAHSDFVRLLGPGRLSKEIH